jgi:hypothetical protein
MITSLETVFATSQSTCAHCRSKGVDSRAKAFTLRRHIESRMRYRSSSTPFRFATSLYMHYVSHDTRHLKCRAPRFVDGANIKRSVGEKLDLGHRVRVQLRRCWLAELLRRIRRAWTSRSSLSTVQAFPAFGHRVAWVSYDNGHHIAWHLKTTPWPEPSASVCTNERKLDLLSLSPWALDEAVGAVGIEQQDSIPGGDKMLIANGDRAADSVTDAQLSTSTRTQPYATVAHRNNSDAHPRAGYL